MQFVHYRATQKRLDKVYLLLYGHGWLSLRIQNALKKEVKEKSREARPEYGPKSPK